MEKQKNSLKNVKIGTDLEFLIMKGDEYYPGFLVTEGRKDKPIEVLALGEGYVMHNDNVGLEVALPPSKVDKNGRNEFSKNIFGVLQYLNEEFLKPQNCVVDKLAVAKFDEKYLYTEEGMKSGCEPDFNAWAKTVNDSPNMGLDIRCVGKN